ncbi:hypothetical protein JCM8202_000275 [Rhodotorula sphaerocarpa]
MARFSSLRPSSLFVRPASVNSASGGDGNARPASGKAESDSVTAAHARAGHASLGLDVLTTVPLTPPPAFNASFMHAQAARMARRSPLALPQSAPKRLNEGEQERLQGLMRAESVRVPTKAGSGRFVPFGPPQGESRWSRFRVWLRHEGAVPALAAVWILIQVAVFAIGVIRYDFSPKYGKARATFGPFFVVARSAALVLHVDIAFILLPVCRNFVTIVRNLPLKKVLPIDEAIQFHKFAAWSIIFFTAVHTIAHIANSWLLGHAMSDTTMGALTHALMCNLTTGPFATGWAMIALLALMAFFAADKRRRAHFERFYYSHMLFLPFFTLWQLHGMFCMIRPDAAPYCSWKQVGVFWFYWSFGGLLYVSERLLREVRSRHRTFISKVVYHPNKVVELHIRKEHTRRMRPGQYIMINCPAVSYWQWHPFTLTSAPEEEDLSVHIRIVGDWTREFAKALGCEPGSNEPCSKDLGGEDPKESLGRVLPRIMVDGPFGSAAEDAFDHEVAVLVGAGIGVTPFASILKHIWYQISSRKEAGRRFKLRKVYFFWIAREPAAFEWFQSLLQALEEQDHENVIEVCSFVTGHLEDADIDNIFTNDVGRDRDVVTGLKAPTHYGRPNWDRIFNSIAVAHPATSIGVFFCGPDALSATLHKMCLKHTSGQPGAARFSYSKERF